MISIEVIMVMLIFSLMLRVSVVKKVIERSIRLFCFIFVMCRILVMLMRLIMVVMMIVLSVVYGSEERSGVKKAIVTNTTTVVNIEASGVRAPAESLTAVRENPPVMG